MAGHARRCRVSGRAAPDPPDRGRGSSSSPAAAGGTAAAARSARAPRLVQIGPRSMRAFTSPRPAATPRASSWSSSAGRIASSGTAGSCAARSWTSRPWWATERAGTAERAFAPDCAAQPTRSTSLRRPGRGLLRVGSRRSHRRPRPRRTGRRPAGLRVDRPQRNHTGGLAAFGPDGRPARSATGVGGRPPRAGRQRPEPRRPAGQDPAHRPRRQPDGRRLRRARRQPLRAPRGARGRRSTPTACATPGASPSTAGPVP